jgi:hypothetical protein
MNIVDKRAQSLEAYASELAALVALFGQARVAQVLPRLKHIYEYTEARWYDYIAQLPGGIVRYLLIAEAPPWSETDPPTFALDPNAHRISSLLGKLCRTFDCRGMSPADSLHALAQRGFLLIDSIPFAMEYSSGQKRRNAHYDRLVQLSATTYLHPKIQASGLRWSPDLRIAFSLGLNALSILKTVTHLRAAETLYPLSSHMIVADRSGYPNSDLMKAAFGLAERSSTAP